jgi:hypothetical protein
MESESYGVSVFSIHPGAVRTAMVEEARHIVPVVQQALDANEVKPDVAAILFCLSSWGQATADTGDIIRPFLRAIMPGTIGRQQSIGPRRFTW